MVMPPLDKKMLTTLAEKNHLKIVETRQPLRLSLGVWTGGEIETRENDELTKGLYTEKSGAIVPDDFRDEITIYAKVKNKGLVIITGCAHAGIINTVEMGKELSGIDKVYALIGGLHMNWANEESMKKETEYLSDLNPEIVSPLHCSGVRFTAELMNKMPQRVAIGVVGTVLKL